MEYIILLVTLAGIVFGADFLVTGSVSLARRFKISDFVIGAAIVGVGTSMPEFVVSFIGALNGNADVAIGNVVGSDIFNILGILGCTSILFPVFIDKKNMRFEIPLCIGLSILLAILAFNFFNGSAARIGRLDGLLLLAVFAGYMWYSFYRDRKNAVASGDKTQVDNTPQWLVIVKVVGGLALLVTSCDLFVDNAVAVAKSFGVNDAFISLTLIACGTSLPELAASITAAVKKNNQMALGNIVGSNIFNISLILGLCAQVRPLTSAGITIVDYIVMIAEAVLLMLFGIKGKIGRAGGILMVISFVAYTWYLVTNQIA